METTFENSVNILVKAYLNDTLKSGSCKQCAIGNLLEGYGCEQPYFWPQLMYKHRNPNSHIWGTDVTMNEFIGLANKEVSLTSYTIAQISKIERAFESTYLNTSKANDYFPALMAVVDVLAEIHNIDLSTKEASKALFVKEYV